MGEKGISRGILRDQAARKTLQYIFFWTLAFGLVAHGYRYFNANFNYDSLIWLYEPNAQISMVRPGRFMRPVYRLLRGDFALPALGGFLSLVYLSVTAFFLVNLLGIQKKSYMALTCGLLVVNSSMIPLNATYCHDVDAYCLSILLSVLGVWAAMQWKHGKLWAVLFYCCSLGLYQAYIGVAVYLVLILAMMELLRGTPVKETYLQLFRQLLVIFVSMVVYFITARVVQAVTHLNDAGLYNSLSSLREITFSAILSRIGLCFYSEGVWLLWPPGNGKVFLIGANVLMVALAVGCGIGIQRRRKLGKASVWGIIGVLAAIPFGMSTVMLISDIFHWLILYPYNLSYLLVLVLVQENQKLSDDAMPAKRCSWLWAVLAGVLIFENCLYANETYLKKELESDATLSVFTRIIDRMEQTEGFDPQNNKVAIIGDLVFFEHAPFAKRRDGFEIRGDGNDINFSPSFYDSIVLYLTYYLGYPVTCTSWGEASALGRTDYVQQMPLFPAEGSVQMVDDILVIKIS